MFSGLFQPPNTTNVSQCNITPRVTYHSPFYLYTNIPEQPHYPEENTNGDAVVTRDMNTAYEAKAGQINAQRIHAVEGTHSYDKGNDEQYVAWDGSGLSLIRRD